MTTPSDISIDGYTGNAFQRTSPADMSDCTRTRCRPRPTRTTTTPCSRAWRTKTKTETWAGRTTTPGETETLWVLDVDGTIIILNTRVAAGQPAAAHAEFAAALDSIRIDRP